MTEQSDSSSWTPPDSSSSSSPSSSSSDPSSASGREPGWAGGYGNDPGPYQGSYGQPAYDQPPYGQAQYGQPQYGQAPYGPPQYGQPQYGPPQYGPPQYAQPPYGPQPGMPGPHPYHGPPAARGPWVVPVRPGVPFHQMARTDAHRWWRPLVGTVAVLGAAFLATAVLMILGIIGYVVVNGEPPEMKSDTSLFGNINADLGFNLAALALLIPIVFLGAWGVQRRRPGTLSSVVGRLRWRWLLACCGLALVFLFVSFGASALAGIFGDVPDEPEGRWVGWADFLLPALIVVALVPFQASAEEYVFRGWIPQAVGACTLQDRPGGGGVLGRALRTPWPGILLGAVLFTSLHGYTGWGLLDIFMFGAIAGWLTVRTGGLEAAIALHVFNNLMAFLLPAAFGRLTLEQGAVPWQYVVADVVPMLLYAAGAWWLSRRLRVETVTPGAPAPRPEEPAVAGRPADPGPAPA
ncbi:hypothetical protein GCM10009678_17430 [Actinomadura kijaniata]|uniref:Membrane protease YdiL (CAAX protease family) n=1 Tax=Actinomadura namibiensis TaxID=182080 RepID=A0A7W3QIX9_ACTNM|nr:CPBP family intramembrane glutamic endopeptidase [Actinomadura namibiensis]MBA8948776.1 membrane protease YdiL (CAAX protease family) [Actinomadura namibiensis]